MARSLKTRDFTNGIRANSRASGPGVHKETIMKRPLTFVILMGLLLAALPSTVSAQYVVDPRYPLNAVVRSNQDLVWRYSRTPGTYYGGYAQPDGSFYAAQVMQNGRVTRLATPFRIAIDGLSAYGLVRMITGSNRWAWGAAGAVGIIDSVLSYKAARANERAALEMSRAATAQMQAQGELPPGYQATADGVHYPPAQGVSVNPPPQPRQPAYQQQPVAGSAADQCDCIWRITDSTQYYVEIYDGNVSKDTFVRRLRAGESRRFPTPNDHYVAVVLAPGRNGGINTAEMPRDPGPDGWTITDPTQGRR